MLDPFRQGDTFDPATIHYVLDERELRAVLALLPSSSEIVIDLETTGLDEHATAPVPARVVIASLTLPQLGHELDEEPGTWVVALSHPECPSRNMWRLILTTLAQAIKDSGRPITNANLGFDMRWIEATTGVDLTDQFWWDTQISSHLLDENRSTKLKERAPETFGVRRWDDHDLSYPGAAEDVPFYDLATYAARDTYWTWRLAVAHRMMTGQVPDPEWPQTPEDQENYRIGDLASWCAMPTAATLTKISQRGMLLDVDWVGNRLTELDAQRERTFNALESRYGDIPGTPSFSAGSHWFQEWASRACDAGDLRISSLTPTGRPQWSKTVLTRLARNGSQVAQDLLDHRQAVKLSEFLRSWTQLADENHLIHSTYHAGRVVTGRLSSSDPNMQQITHSLKPAFIPRPGYYMAELDFSQLELRVAAYVSRCEPMLEAYRRGDDLHRLTAASTMHKRPEDVTKDERKKAKAINFGFIYGMGSDGFQEYADASYGAHFTEEEAVHVREQFFKAYPELVTWHSQMTNEVRRYGQVVSPIGRVRRLPDAQSTNMWKASHAERNAINSPVQGFGSDLMQIAAARIAGTMPGTGPGVEEVHAVGTVHDSLVLEVPVDGWQRAVARCMRIMIDPSPVLSRLGCELDVPLAVEAEVGTRWGLADVGIIA